MSLRIIESKTKYLEECLNIAKALSEWFTKEAIKNMKIDFNVNNLAVAVDNKKTCGFLCYSSHDGIMNILWLAVDRGYHRKGVGSSLLEWLIKKAKTIRSRAIEVKTLAESEDYNPYNQTRAFYKKHGFKKLYTEQPRKPGWDSQDVWELEL